MTAEHQRLRERLGALALGLLDGAEQASVREHLADCASCRAELDHLERVAQWIDTLGGPGLGQPARPPSGSAERLFDRLALLRRRERTRRLASAAVAALALAAVSVAFLVAVRPEPELPSRPIAFTEAPVGVAATAELRDWGWGTQMYLTISGLESDQRLAVWLERPDGSRVSAGTFRTTGGELRMTLGAGASTADAVALGISDAEGTTLLFAPL